MALLEQRPSRWRRAWDLWEDMPLLMHVGLLVVFLGAAFDSWAHVAAGDIYPTFTRLTPAERLGHWIILAGMLVSLAGVVARGYRRPASPNGGTHD
jgi:hypothetical protein